MSDQSFAFKQRRLNELNKERVKLEEFIQNSEARRGVRLILGGLDSLKDISWNGQTGIPFYDKEGKMILKIKIGELSKACAFFKAIGEKNGTKMA